MAGVVLVVLLGSMAAACTPATGGGSSRSGVYDPLPWANYFGTGLPQTVLGCASADTVVSMTASDGVAVRPNDGNDWGHWELHDASGQTLERGTIFQGGFVQESTVTVPAGTCFSWAIVGSYYRFRYRVSW